MRNLIGGLSAPGVFPQLSQLRAPEGKPLASSVQPAEEKALTIDAEEKRSSQTPGGAVRKTADSSSKMGKMSKQKLDIHPETSVRPTAQHFSNIGPLNHNAPGTSSMNLMPNNNLLPVLGLCAPNASRLEMSQRNYEKSFYRQSRQHSGPDFPFPVAPCSGALNEMGAEVHARVAGRHRLPDISPDVLQQHANNNLVANTVLFSLSLIHVYAHTHMHTLLILASMMYFNSISVICSVIQQS